MAPLSELDANLILAGSSNLDKAIQGATANLNGKRPVQAVESDYSDDDEAHIVKWNCNQIRTKINRLIRSGEMKVTEFQRSLGINSNSYGRFMKLKGPFSGCDNQTYLAAHEYFLSREAKGIKMPRAKKAKAEDIAKFDVTAIRLAGEESEAVIVYDTCDDIRTKIQAHLRNPGITQAAFLREIGKTHTPPRSIQSKQLSDFLRKKGPTSGNTSVIYYASYVYFEKLRIKNGDKKSNKRLQVERNVPQGMTLEPQWNRGVWLRPGEDAYEDEFGRVRVVR